jgi:hypothetical protein
MSDISQANLLLISLTKTGKRIAAEAMAEAEQLASEGLAYWKNSRAGRSLALTEAGVEEKKIQQAKARKASAKPARVKAVKAEPLTVEALKAWGQTFKAELLEELAGHKRAQGQDPDDSILAAQVVATVKALSPSYRRLVPIPVIRHQFPGVSEKALTRVLLSLEQNRTVDLKIANDPTGVSEPEAGIRVDDRGLVYFAIVP